MQTNEKIWEDWTKQFNQTDTSKRLSGFPRSVERVLASLFSGNWLPNSAPIGSDLMYETVDAIVHIDIKTMLYEQVERGKINVGLNQTSYFEGARYAVKGYLPFA